MKKSVVALLHVGFWGYHFLLIMVILAVLFQYNEDEARIAYFFKVMLAFAVLPSAIAFYSFYFFIFPYYLKHKKTFNSIVFGLVISLASGIISFLVLNLVAADDCTSEGGDNTTNIGVIFFIAFISSISGIVALVLRGFIIWFEEIKLKDALQKKNHEMELALVKSQLDPHFLFNTLNNIDVLILKNATVASNYLNKLSDIMRFMLFETKTDKILLSKEIEYIEKYIELQKIRTSNLDYVHFSVKGEAATKTIAPMVFIPFIENAFKHTNNKKLENAITIEIQIDKDFIKLTCVNKYNPNAKIQGESNGLGNELIKKRLGLIYPSNHVLEIINQNDQYSVFLTLENG